MIILAALPDQPDPRLIVDAQSVAIGLQRLIGLEFIADDHRLPRGIGRGIDLQPSEMRIPRMLLCLHDVLQVVNRPGHRGILRNSDGIIRADGDRIALRPDTDKFVETNLQVVLSNAVRDILTNRANELTALATGSKADPRWTPQLVRVIPAAAE